MEKSKARIIIENLNRNQVLQHKKEKDFFIEYDGSGYIVYRNQKIIAIYDKIKPIETIVKHHGTRNWEIVEYLGEKYWSDTVIDGIIANDFDLSNAVKKMVLKRQPLCQCGKFGTKILFKYKGQLYSFDFLTGYPCECDA